MADAEDDHKEEPTEQPQEQSAGKKKSGQVVAKLKGKHKDLWQWALANKKWSIPGAVVALVLLLAAVPYTRYPLAATFLKRNFSVVVLDSQTSKPVTSAQVVLKGKSVFTDSKGIAKLHVPVGYATLEVVKAYYKSFSEKVTVPINPRDQAFAVKLEATGRQVPVTILNTVGGKAVAGATITAGDSKAKTDDKGEATLVVPIGKDKLDAVIKANGYNDANVTLTVTTDKIAANSYRITPAGKIYFLSNASGKLDLVKSNLDGTARTVVLPGTGQEDRYNTFLLASRDWKYIALLSKRDGGDHPKLYLIEADSDKLTTVDEGNAEFTVLGWSGDRLVYRVDRANVQYWEAKRQALKSYQASTKKLTVLDETKGQDGEAESYQDAYVLDKEVLFTKNWSSNINGNPATLTSIQSDGSQRKTVKSYAPGAGYSQFLQTRPGDFGEIYVLYNITQDKRQVDAYQDGKLTSTKLTDTDFYNGVYSTYSVSPSGKQTLWSDFRDGKNVLFVGDSSGQNGKQIGSSEDFNVYGWYGDDYILLTRKNSEMRIMPADGLKGGVDASLKVTDYYKPNNYLRGFGYGYGG